MINWVLAVAHAIVQRFIADALARIKQLRARGETRPCQGAYRTLYGPCQPRSRLATCFPSTNPARIGQLLSTNGA